MQPLASVYSGHQFGVWAGQLGDGRALLLGEVARAGRAAGAAAQGQRADAVFAHGRRPRGAALVDPRVPVLRGDARARHPDDARAGLVGSPLPVRRETVETAAVVTRVAPSFLRFGHFEHFAHTAQDPTTLRRLADSAIDALLPGLPRRARQPVRRAARGGGAAHRALIAQWQAVGFCHGVMNTDNMSMLGLTIDYGPFDFLDAFDPGHICNHSDHQGRYA